MKDRVVDDKPDLLEILDALVLRDGETSGLTGEVCIGVRGSSGYRWWRASFTPTLSTRFLERPSNSAHATLFIGADDAEALLATGHLPSPSSLLVVDGDRALMQRFIRRYTSRMSWFEARIKAIS